MKFFKGADRLKGLLDKLRTPRPADRSNSLDKSVKPAAVSEVPGATALERMKNRIILHKWMVIKSVSALGLMAAVVVSGHELVEANMNDYYQVYANGDLIGIVSDPSKVEEYKQKKREQLSKSESDLRMVVTEPKLELTPERVFNHNTEDQAVLDKLSGYFSSYPVGVQLVVDGKPMGIVKDEAAAKTVLDQIKNNAIASMQTKKTSGRVSILSASPAAGTPVQTELQKADFVQKVDLQEVKIEPNQLANPEDLRKKLETGDVQPTKYTVEKGDCVSCIAQKLNIPKQVIYQNNPTITDDMIKVGQQLDLTVLKPTLAVRTVEKVVENQEIAYETEVKQDDNMRLGESEVLSPGKNGLKKMTFQLTKVNGLLEAETVLSEEIVQQPVKAVVKKGTKVIKGEGTGKFAWPVLSASISSTFGTRWGAFHKGVDLTGNRNIMASDNGKVVFAGEKSGYGNCIIIDHMNGYRTLYGHLSQIDTSVGKIVEKGEKIGYMGSTGNSTGIHLHFEVQKGETPENPLKYLNQ
ncbi:M23 family metallopeptidase [Paenibacillus tyrfis]|uniref:M23 family metallopeptidase n=1 Tax=Paenibacillus tyrfis TaxID=1501230 RepID=UPI00209F3919|nr:M23 family metallopeptidase [Paenibacillus tyrfis]MCP1308504.1 M23 family metallopeptidase [Paenibacillus tyrfis]